MDLFTFGIGFITTPALPGTRIGGQSFRDFPPTPKAPEPWVLGCVQNVTKQSITVVWVDNRGAEISETQSFTTQMLDADPDVPGTVQHLPFTRLSNGPGVPPCLMALLYGLPGPVKGVPVAPPKGPGPAWDAATGGTGPFSIITTDAPSVFVFAFKGGGQSGSPNPIVEVSRSLTVQVWLTAVPVTDMRDASKHNILGYTNEIALEGKYDRRAAGGSDPSSAGWFHFNGADFTLSSIIPEANIGNTKPPSRRPVVQGPLSVEPVKTWLKARGFSG